jgi:septal ring factor EnvC (AmiA/AmiB activator)
MKKILLSCIVLVAVALFFVSCSSGVSQEQYKKATDDLTAAQAQIQVLQAQLSSAQSQVQSLQAGASSSETQVKSLQSDLQTANSKISKVKILSEILNSMMNVYQNSETMTNSQMVTAFLEWTNGIKTIGDPQLSAKYDLLVNAKTEAQQNQASEDFMMYLFQLQSKLLQ